jgi:hypothetical protein
VTTEESEVAARFEYEISTLVPRRVPGVGALDTISHSMNEGIDETIEFSGVSVVQPKNAHLIMISPYRARLLAASLYAFRGLFVNSRALMSAPGLVNGALAPFVKENVASSDRLSSEDIEVSMYPRYSLANSRAFLRQLLASTDDFIVMRISKSIFDHSLATARNYFKSLEPGGGELLSDDVRASPLKNMLSTVQRAPGVSFMESAGSLLLGGKLRLFDVDFSDTATMHELKRGMCCVAIMALLPPKCFTMDVRVQMIAMIIAPFYGSATLPGVGLGGQQGIREGVIDVATRYLTQGGLLPRPTRITSFSAMGQAAINFCRNTLTGLLGLLTQTQLTQVTRPMGLFPHPIGGDVLTLCAPALDTPNVLAHGLANGDKTTFEYTRFAARVRSMLKTYLDCASQSPRYKHYGLYFDSFGLDSPDHLAKSFGVFNSLLSVGLTDHDCYSATPVWATSTMLQPVSIPFEGALSLVLYGVDSSEVIMKGEAFRFTDQLNTTIPSLYSAYLFLEACVARDVREYLRDDDVLRGAQIRNRYMKELHNVCVRQMEKWFDRTDPNGGMRFSELIRIAMVPNGDRTPGEDAIFTIIENLCVTPNTLLTSSTIGTLEAPVPPLRSTGDVIDGFGDAKASDKGRACYSRKVSAVYIPLTPPSPVRERSPYHVNTQGTLVYAFTQGDVVSLDQILQSSVATRFSEFTPDNIRKMLHWYNTANNTTHEYVKIDCVTTFSLAEVRLEADGFYNGPSISMKPFEKGRANRSDVKFEVGEVAVQCAVLPDRLNEALYLGSYGTYDAKVLIDYEELVEGLVFHDTTLGLDDPNAIAAVVDRDDLLRKSSVRSKTGAVIANYCYVHVPKSEKYIYPESLTRSNGMVFN